MHPSGKNKLQVLAPSSPRQGVLHSQEEGQKLKKRGPLEEGQASRWHQGDNMRPLRLLYLLSYGK